MRGGEFTTSVGRERAPYDPSMRLPLFLTLLRAALGPAVVGLAYASAPRRAILACIVVGFASDVADGMIARRAGLDTEALRRLDSVADSAFWIGVAWAAWHLEAPGLLPYLPGVAAIVVLELTRYVFDAVKFGREASWHAYSAKAWGVSLFLAAVSVIGLGRARPAVDAAVALGIVADVEGLAISVVLPRWTRDVPSLAHAWRLRRRAGENGTRRRAGRRG